MIAADLVSKLARPRKTKTGWRAACPAHKDGKRSLLVANDDEGGVNVSCSAGCSPDAILNRLSLGKRALLAEHALAPAVAVRAVEHSKTRDTRKLKHDTNSVGCATTASDISRGAPPAETDLESEARPPTRRYQVVGGRISCVRPDRLGRVVFEPLANFDARIEEEITRDDGVEQIREFKISGSLEGGVALPPAIVPARDFGGLAWVCGAWGARAVVSAGSGAKDHLRAAIQNLSTPAQRTIFRHTGWRRIGGRWLFLFHRGAVGSEAVEVDLDPPLDRFTLPAAVEHLREAIVWSFRLLDCGPREAMLPILASVYLAPLCSVLEPDLTMWIYGPTGSLKSELATVAERHFGTFSRKSLPCSWSATENALEARLHTLQDMLVVIDDYAPQTDARAGREQEKKAERILRSVGNRASRARLHADLTVHADRPPRGLPFCTGEVLPRGASINARTIQVEIDREKLDLRAISALQENGHRLAHAMRGYLEWLAPRLDELRLTLPVARDEMRRQLQDERGHMRQPEALANLYVALDLFFQFAEQEDAIDEATGQQLREEALVVFEALAARMREKLEEVDPAEQFIEVLVTLLHQGEVQLVDKSLEAPRGGPEVIGWISGDRVLVLHGAAYRCVAQALRRGGDHWNPGVRPLFESLRKKGYIVATDSGRSDTQWRVGSAGQRVRGWALAADLLPVTAAVTAGTAPRQAIG